MLLVFFVALRCVYAGSPHAVYGVPPVETNFGSSQLQRTPPLTGHSSGTQWAVNPYSQQSTQAWKNGYQSQPGRTKPAPSYWGGTYDNYRPSALAASQKGVKLISAASATYRPYSGSPPDQRIAQEFYSLHSFPPTNNQYTNQRNDPNAYYNRPGDSSDSRYNDFLRRYYDWYYKNAYREASTATGYYPPGSLQPPGDPGYRELQGAYSPPSPATAGGGVPWWLHGGFSRPAPAANSAPVTSSAPFPSSSSGGPVGPFTAPPVELSSKRPIPKKASLSASIKPPGKAPGASLITDRIIEGPTSESHESSKTEEEKPYSEAEATSEATTASEGSSEPESKDTNSPADSVTTPETASSEEESSSPSSEESSSPSSEESSSPSSEESASPSTEETSSSSSEESPSPSSEESSSPSSEESSSPSSEESSSPSSEESSSSSSVESSSPSSEESSSSSSEEISSPSTEESSSPSSEESLSPSTEESSSPSTEENSSPSSEDSSTTDNVTTSSDSSEMNTIKKDD